jgi:hypothetical protein
MATLEKVDIRFYRSSEQKADAGRD